MQIITTITDLRAQLKLIRAKDLVVGFVPTMGYLHDGHKGLMLKSHEQCDITVVSVFVNPLQFGPNDDLSKYPRDLARDTQLCIDAKVDILFTPSASELITDNLAYVNVKKLDEHLCGAKRSEHFQGVCTIVAKLFNIVQPDYAFLGKKDIQQVQILSQMVKDLNFPINIVGVDTIRNKDGLALSSRNSYLKDQEQTQALIVPTVINQIVEQINDGLTRKQILDNAQALVAKHDNCKIDYIDIVDSHNLQPTDNFKQDIIIAVAIFVGTTRLIDNHILKY